MLTVCLASCTTPRLTRFERTLAAQDSATAALSSWCRTQRLADPPTITAQRIAGADLAPSGDVRRLLGVGRDEPIGYRHVRLSCGGKVLSVAHNWYVPARLTPAMNHILDSTDTPFGRVAASLRFTRQPLADPGARLPACPPGTILAHRARLLLAGGQPLSLLVECYTRANLSAR